jgi:REP element-mobilizing transposase RayT
MPRLPRLFLPGGTYHVYCRVARGEPVFACEDEAREWINTVACLAEAHELTVLAWCLMSNHYHLVLRTGGKVLWKAMARIQGTIAKNFNRRHRYLGRLWQSRYKARLVLDDGYLSHLFAYVHLNPVAAGMVNDPAEHPWSGHRALVGLDAPQLVKVGPALSCFDDDPPTARRIYQDRLRTIAELRLHERELTSLPWWREVREDDQTIAENAAPPGAVMYSGQPLPPESHRRPPLGDVLQKVEKSLNLPEGHLKGGTRSQLDSWYRCLFCTLAVSWLGFSNKEVTCCLNKGRNSVSRWLSEGYRLQQSDPEFLENLHALRSLVSPEDAR